VPRRRFEAEVEHELSCFSDLGPAAGHSRSPHLPKFVAGPPSSHTGAEMHFCPLELMAIAMAVPWIRIAAMYLRARVS
jgi:hypothetical protein